MTTIYLEKYSIAPPPSRDYYGIKILEDEVKLFHWRISYGPHKTPLTLSSNFIDWKNNKLLQSEIACIFGESWCQYADDIISNTKTLLTLPKNLIQKLLKYLLENDIFKLFSLCRIAHEIFDTNLVWKSLCKRLKTVNWTTVDEKYGMAFDWKQLYKETQKIGMHHGSNKTSKLKISKPETKLQEKISSHELLAKPQLEVIDKMSARTKNIPTNSRTKMMACPDRRKCFANDYVDEVKEGKSFVNIVNLRADDLDLISNPKQTRNLLETKVRAMKNNFPAKAKIPTISKQSKSNYQKFRTNNHERLRVSRSTVLSPKYHSTMDHSLLKTDDIPLDDLVKHTIEEFDNQNEIFNAPYNWPINMSSPEEQSIIGDSSRQYTSSSLSDKYETKYPRIYDSSISENISRSSFGPSKMREKIHELSAWQATKLKMLKSSGALQTSTSIEKIINSEPSRLPPRIRKKI